VRAYEDRVDGRSRGIFFVEYDDDVDVERVAVELQAQRTDFLLTFTPFYMTSDNWDRCGGWLPELPTDPPQLRPLIAEGYGSCGFRVRCGAELGIANTTLQPDEVRRLAKRLREQN
jgi:hypothetical protein